MKVLITSGGCKVAIDEVRHIGNFSSGRYGVELAREFNKEKHEVLFFREWDSVKFRHDDTTYRDYYDYLNVKNMIKNWQPDIIISAAAISDYLPDKVQGKISSDGEELILTLKKGEKVIKSFRELAPNACIVGFKLLVGPTRYEMHKAVTKVFNAGVDFVVYNDLLELRKGNATRTLIGQTEFGPGILKDFNDPNYLVKFLEEHLLPK